MIQFAVGELARTIFRTHEDRGSVGAVLADEPAETAQCRDTWLHVFDTVGARQGSFVIDEGPLCVDHHEGSSRARAHHAGDSLT